jgi:protein-disulfide isomerase/uncharacterized membrane protein
MSKKMSRAERAREQARSGNSPAPRARRSGPPVLNRTIFGIALAGVLLTIHLSLSGSTGYELGCVAGSDPSACGDVIASRWGTVFGISNILLGMMFYVGVAALRAARPFVAEHVRPTVRAVSFGVVGAGFAYSMFLVGVQAFDLGQFCTLCLISATLVTALFAMHLFEHRRPAESFAPRSEMRYFSIAAVALLALAMVDFAFMSRADVPQHAGAVVAASDTTKMQYARYSPEEMALYCTYDPELRPLSNPDDFIYEGDVFIGRADAPVRLIKFFDPNCPHCKTLHHVIEDTLPEYGEDVRLYLRPFPLWDFSVPQVQAMYLAREQGKYFEMIDRQFKAQRQGGLRVGELIDIARDLGMDPARFRSDLSGGRYVSQINRERDQIAAAGLKSVPRLTIEGKFLGNYEPAWTPECIGGMINQERTRLTTVAE